MRAGAGGFVTPARRRPLRPDGVPADNGRGMSQISPPATGAQADLEPKEAAQGGLPLRVLQALGERKVVVLLFWTPKAVEDKAVRKALTNVDRHKGKVLAHATHIKRIANYQQITRGADVVQSPTTLVIDRNRKVQSLVGYVDRRSIDQAVTDALRAS